MFCFLSPILTALGDIIIGVAVVRVHIKLSKEHKFDLAVEKAVKKEKILVLIGIFFIIIGVVLEIVYRSSIR